MREGTRFSKHRRGCVLTVNSWEGALPLPGEYVKSARGRTAFMVLEVRRAPSTARYVAKLVCERHPADTLSADARVYGWAWAKR